MIVRDTTNTRPPELLASWLDALGTFDALTPHDAAERWSVPVRVTNRLTVFYRAGSKRRRA